MPRPAADRGSAAVSLAVAAALVILLTAVLTGAVAGIARQEAAACTAQPAASRAAAAIPANYLADYKKAGASYGIPWTVLAGIGTVESGNGRNDGLLQRRRARPDAVPACGLAAPTATAATS